MIVTVALGVCAGLITALVTNVLVRAFPDHFFQVWGVATLFVLAIGMPIAAFQVIFGIAGTAIGVLLFLVIGNPAAGGSSAPSFSPASGEHSAKSCHLVTLLPRCAMSFISMATGALTN